MIPADAFLVIDEAVVRLERMVRSIEVRELGMV
jgi:hypothetical protein